MNTTTLETNRVAEFEASEPMAAVADRADHAPQRNAINISPEMVTESTADLPPEHRDLLRWMYGYCREMHWSWDQFQGHTKLNKNTFYKLWTGKYTDADGNRISAETQCIAIARIKKLVVERADIRPAKFVETSIFKRIDKICQETRLMQTITMIYGESQIGKTVSLEEVTRRNNHGQTAFFRIPAASGEFIREFAKACYISPKNSISGIRDKIFRYLDHTKLLIVDELHLVFEIYNSRQVMRTMETLREVHDKTKCGLVLCGTDVFRRELATGDHAKMLNQLRRRGIYELQLPATAPMADVDAIAASYALKPATGEAADLVKLIIVRDGLGKFTRYLAKASQMAARNKDKLGWDHFIKVHLLTQKMSNFTE
jgi:DNA transposition AAA+ family ATPase